MKIDCHTHGKLAKKLPFSSTYTNWLFDEARQSGLDAICLTEHFNTLGFDEVYHYLKENYEIVGDSFKVGDLSVFPGMEIDIAEGGHFLAIGKVQDILTLNAALTPYKVKGNFLPFKKLLKLTKAYPILLGAAHAFREGSFIPNLPLEELKELDFLDLNGKDVALSPAEAPEQISVFAKKLGLPILAGSDTHQATQYGCIYNTFSQPCYTVQALREEIKKDTYTITTADTISFQVKTAGILKRALKEIHALGGDYVRVLVGESEEV